MLDRVRMGNRFFPGSLVCLLKYGCTTESYDTQKHRLLCLSEASENKFSGYVLPPSTGKVEYSNFRYLPTRFGNL